MASLLVLTLVLSGCRIYGDEYLVISKHIEQHQESDDSDGLTAENYSELKAAIDTLVINCIDSGVIRLQNYSGDVGADVSTCLENLMSDPLGVYAIEYIPPFELTRLLTYYEVTVNITYRRTKEQIDSVLQFGTVNDYVQALEKTCADYGGIITAFVPSAVLSQVDVQDSLDRYHYNNPFDSLARPEFSYKRYPDTGNFIIRRIIEVELGYKETADELRSMSAGLRQRANELTEDIDPKKTEPLQVIAKLFATAMNETEYLPGREDDISSEIVFDSGFTAYGALIEGSAASEGYALAFKALCDLMEIECTVVIGRYNGLRHCWNLVKYNDSWYHVDASLNDYLRENYFLKTDEQFLETHKWNTTSYTACDGEIIEYPVSANYSAGNE